MRAFNQNLENKTLEKGNPGHNLLERERDKQLQFGQPKKSTTQSSKTLTRAGKSEVEKEKEKEKGKAEVERILQELRKVQESNQKFRDMLID